MVNILNVYAVTTMLLVTRVPLILLVAKLVCVQGVLEFGKRCNKFAPIGEPDTCDPEKKLVCLFGACTCSLGSKYDKGASTCLPPSINNMVDTQKFGARNLRRFLGTLADTGDSSSLMRVFKFPEENMRSLKARLLSMTDRAEDEIDDKNGRNNNNYASDYPGEEAEENEKPMSLEYYTE